MTKKETVKLFGLISIAYPRDRAFSEADSASRDLWFDMLKDFDFQVVQAALRKHISLSEFPPSIAEIRKYATEMISPPIMTAEEAWKVARDTMRKYGCSGAMNYTTGMTGIERAKKNCDPTVWKVMEMMGYRDMCLSENTDVIRGQFMKIWNNMSQRESEYRITNPVVGELAAKISEKLLLDGGENGEIV